MVDLEADDALASAARRAALDPRVERVCIWTPDKDLAQCVVADRVVTVNRRTGKVQDEQAVIAKFGVTPNLIPDYLALVGDSADGYPGVPGIGPVTAARLLRQHGPLEAWPADVLSDAWNSSARLFKRLATLRTDAELFEGVEGLEWKGAGPAFPELAVGLGDERLALRAEALQRRSLPSLDQQ